MTKLRDDGSNWFEIKDRAYNQLLAQGLASHLRGIVDAPGEIFQAAGEWYASSDTMVSRPMSQSELGEYEKKLDEHAAKEARGNLVLMDILPTHIYLKLCHKPTLRDRWEALCDLFENHVVKGRLKTKLLFEFMSTKHSKDKPMNSHLQHLKELEVKLESTTYQKSRI